MKSVISYTLSHCVKCLKCLRICPTEAITIVHERVQIDSHKCINCGHCIEVCNTQGLQGKGSTLIDINNYDKTVALLPSALLSCCGSLKEAARLVEAIGQTGFDEVVQMSEVEGALLERTAKIVRAAQDRPLISSFCPVVNRLIRLKFPMLLERVVDLDYPAEIAARRIRQQYGGKGRIGIFYFCECVSKLQLARYPYGNEGSEIDHAVSISDQFPLINRLRQNDARTLSLCAKGLAAAAPHTGALEGLQVLEADGRDQVMQVLELAEFGLLNRFDYLSLSFCTNGCIGGQLLWGNPFEARLNLNQLLQQAHSQPCTLNDLNLSRPAEPPDEDLLTMREKLRLFARINEVMEKLPHYDCGACGFASCRNMAENIALGKRKWSDCRIIGGTGGKEDDGQRID